MFGRRSGSKVAVVGWHRTATTSLQVALDTLGYRVSGFSYELCNDLMAGQMRPIWRALRRPDAVRDFPWTLLYSEIDSKYPGSKFILTDRDPEDWIESYKRHDANNPDARFHSWLYGPGGPEGNEQRFIDRFRAHNAAVRDRFRGTGQLLEFDVFGGDRWEKLCEFLGCDVPDEPFPDEKSRVL